jgi:dynein heavy chain
VKAKIPPIFDVLIAPRLTALEEVLTPGCVSITWASPNVDAFCDSTQRAVEQFELLVTRIQELITYRIEAVLHDIVNTPLIDLNEEEPVLAEDFLERTQRLCDLGGQSIQIRSSNVEEACEELIELVYPDYKTKIETLLAAGETAAILAEKQNTPAPTSALSNPSATSRATSTSTNKSGGQQSQSQRHQQQQQHQQNSHKPTLLPQQLTTTQLHLKKKREALIAMQEAAQEVFSYFNHKNLEAIVKLVKVSLEKLRKRIANAILNANYGSATTDYIMGSKRREVPVFKAYAILAIPNINMQPTLDDIQHTVTKAVQLVLMTTKQINQWKDLRKRVVKKEVCS